MRILLISKKFDFGGSENHLCDLANGLAERGHQVYLLAADGRQRSRLDGRVIFTPIHFSDALLPFHLMRLISLIRGLHIQVIHSHQRLAVRLACFLGRLTGVPVVATVHGRTRHDLGGRYFRKTVNRVIFVSKHVQQRAMRFRELSSKSVFIPNGITADGVLPYRPDRLLYLSRIDHHHGELLLMLINSVMPQLVVHNPRITLAVIGDGRQAERVRRAGQALNAKLNRPAVMFQGFQSEPHVQLAGTMLLGVGRSAMTALAKGLPVLSVNHRHLGTLVDLENYDRLKESNFVHVAGPPPTPATLLPAILEGLARLRNGGLEMSSLRRRLIEDFNQKNIVRQTEAVYREILK